MLLLLIAATALTLLVYYLLVNGGRPVPSAPNWFVLINGALLVGTLVVLDVSDAVALRFAVSQLVGMLCFAAGGLFVNVWRHTNPSVRLEAFNARPLIFDLQGRPWQLVALPLLIVSLAVCGAFGIALGYHVGLTQIVLASLSVAGEEMRNVYSVLRTAPHYGGRYLYIGYVTQFKDFILPTLAVLFLIRAQALGGGRRWMAVLFLLLVNLYFLTITGQRAPLFVFAIMVFLTASSRWAVVRFKVRGRQLNRLMVGFVIVGAFVVFVGVSALRSGAGAGGPGALTVEGLHGFWNRVGPGLAMEKVALARLLADRPASLGADWLKSLATVLPGHEGGLETDFHRMLYGSNRGAAGLVVWESLWMNFRWVGIVAGGLALGIFLQLATLEMWSGRRYASKHVILLFLSFQLAQVAEPYSLLNSGVLTLVLFCLLFRIVRDQSAVGRRSVQASPVLP